MPTFGKIATEVKKMGMSHAEREIPFWLVWNPDGYPPRYRHPSREAAEAEAKRLAADAPGQSFYVLCPTSVSVRHEVVTRRFVSDDIPF